MSIGDLLFLGELNTFCVILQSNVGKEKEVMSAIASLKQKCSASAL